MRLQPSSMRPGPMTYTAREVIWKMQGSVFGMAVSIGTLKRPGLRVTKTDWVGTHPAVTHHSFIDVYEQIVTRSSPTGEGWAQRRAKEYC